ncbi:MAG: GIY-YIG nuclease family protein [Bacteroidales bacterium]|nr:GIY-YIG nuclease family protein [Bacteroidales bacterium]
MGAKAKKIELYLHNGSLDGLLFVSESDGWDLGGILYSCPKDSIDILLNDDSCDKYGVYLLISSDKVYVGQSTDLKKRIEQHKIGKDWWEKVILLTSKNDELNQSYITYLESELIAKARSCGTLDCENKTDGNKNNLDKFTKILLDQYLDEALFILELIGVNVFKKGTPKSIINSVPVHTKEFIETRAKKEVIEFLKGKNIALTKNISYAKIQDNKPMFWLNPTIDCLEEDWNLILNDFNNHILTIFFVPAKTYSATYPKVSGSLVTRKDLRRRIDLGIDSKTFIDTRSKLDFSKFIISQIKY